MFGISTELFRALHDAVPKVFGDDYYLKGDTLYRKRHGLLGWFLGPQMVADVDGGPVPFIRSFDTETALKLDEWAKEAGVNAICRIADGTYW